MTALRKARAMRQLRKVLKTPISVQVRTRHKGVIVSTFPLTLHLDGNTTVAVPAHYLAGYTPTIADVVYVDNVSGDLVVHDKYGS